MATRVNTRFVVFLVVALIAVVGVGSVGVWYLTRDDPDALIAQGDRQVSEGLDALALRSYERALPSRRDDPVLLTKVADLLPRAHTASPAVAERQFQKTLSFKREASQLQPRNAEAADAFLSYGYGLMRQGMAGADMLYAMADDRLDQVQDPASPVLPVAKKYRGVAAVAALTPRTPDDRREQARTDLETALQSKALADDPLTLHHLAMWHLQEAARLSRERGGQEASTGHIATARELSQRAIQAAGDDPTPEQLAHRLEVLAQPLVNDLEAARPVLDRLEQRVAGAAEPDVADVLLASRALRVMDREPQELGDRTVTRGAVRARDLVQAAAAKEPDDLFLALHLGELQQELGEIDAALDQFQKVRKAEPLGDFRRTLTAERLQAAAALAAGEVMVRQAQQADDEAKRDELLEQAREVAADQRKRAGESAQVLLLEGQIELAAGDRDAAFGRLSKASQAFGDNNARTLLLLAQLLQERSQWGAAIGRLERLIQVEPGNVLGRLRLAELLVQARRLDEARTVLAPVREAQPELEPGIAIEAAILQQQGKPEEAIALYEQTDPMQNPAVLQRLVALYREADRTDDALRLLNARLEQEPADIRSLEQALRLDKDPERAQARLAAALEAGAPKQQVDLIRRVVVQREQVNFADVALEAIQNEEDPLKRAVAMARYHAARGEDTEAQAALDEATRLAPDDPAVVELRFDRAVERKDLDEARKLADVASRLDLDGAQGMFFRARLEAARNRLDDAVRLTRAGLSQQPFYSQGYRMLGAMLLQQKLYDEAAGSFRQALDQKPDDLASWQGLAAAYHGQGDRTQALATLRDSLKFGSRNPRLLATYLAYEQTYGDPARAVDVRRQIARAAPGDVDNRRQLALLLARQAQTDAQRNEAVATAEALVAERPDSLADVLTLVGVQRVLDRSDAAVATLRAYVQRRGEEATVLELLNLARLELELGQQDAAVATFDRAIAQDDSENREAARVAADSLYDVEQTELALARYQALREQYPQDAAISLRLAEAMLRLGRVADATTLLDTMQGESASDRASRLLLLSLIARSENDDQTALERLNAAVEANPQMGAARLERGRLLLSGLGSPQQAEADLREALRLGTDEVATRLLLAEALARRGERLEAVTELGRVLAQDPTRSEARIALYTLHVQANDLTAASRVADEGARLSPQDPRWLRLQAQLAASAGRWADAAGAWGKAADLSPDDPSVLDPLAVALIESGQPRRALQRLEAGRELVEGEPVLRAVRGRAQAAAGEVEAGRSELREAVASAGNEVQFQRALGHASAVLDGPQVLELLEAVRDRLPTTAWADLAAAGRENQAGRHAQAAARLAGMDDATLEPQDRARRDRMLAISLQMAGEPQRAEAAYRKALETSPEDAQLLNNLAFLLSEDMGRPEDALPLAQRAVKAQPDSAQVLDTLGWVQHLTGQDREAQATLERSIALQELPHNRLHLGAVMQSLGRLETAKSHLNRAVRLAQEQQATDVLEQAQERLAQIEQADDDGDRP